MSKEEDVKAGELTFVYDNPVNLELESLIAERDMYRARVQYLEEILNQVSYLIKDYKLGE